MTSFSGDSCWQEEERRIVSNSGGEFSRSTFHRRHTNEWIWATEYFFGGIRDGVSLGHAQTCICSDPVDVIQVRR